MVHGHTVAAVIVAAGASRRMGFDKLAYPLDGGTVLEKSVRAFDTHPAIDEILLVAGENAPQAALLAAACAKPAKTVAGGATRVQSVRAGLDAVNAEYVAIHDAARPFVTPQVIWDALEAAYETGDVYKRQVRILTKTEHCAYSGGRAFAGPRAQGREPLWKNLSNGAALSRPDAW